jgi:SAM-dependent methyltransferase
MDGDAWAGAEAYERYVGRWSRAVAVEFVRWLELPPGLDWLDVGCGTGALTGSILSSCDSRRVRGYDRSPQFVAAARERIRDPRAQFAVADARRLPEPDGTFHASVSGLAINFVPRPVEAVAEMRRVVVPGGTVAVYLWDYADGMQMMRVFWDAAVELDPPAAALDEGRRFGFCRPEPLRALLGSAGLEGAEVRAIDVPTRFADFDDYWTPFLGGQGPAPGYVASLDGARRAELRASIERRLPRGPDGGIALTARAWAARARA